MSQEPQQSPFHPGTYLKELLIWRHLSAEEFSATTGIPVSKIIDLTENRKGIDKPTSETLAAYFGNSSEFWLDLQDHFDHANSDIYASLVNRLKSKS